MRIEREMLERNTRTEFAGPQAGLANKQPRQLLIALFLLLVALAVVIGKNRDFWFGSDETLESDAASSESISKPNSVAVPAKTSQEPAAHAITPKNHLARKTSTKPAIIAPTPNDSANLNSPVVATNRTILPPLEVEVVAGDTHRTVHPGSNVAQVEIPNDSNRVSTVTASVAALPANAAERERLSPESVPELRQTVEATYPLLGQHARVQGSVVLQAVVGTDGSIESLRILSGPAILTTAAQQAVRQWRFKPYLQNGQPVETKARITVNFSIQISDNPAKTS
ncbi:MAG: energy transducer TonB [Candidatus Sulfotelmatobacter sp.]|jgi:TonB family protein